jgi:phosphate:Na+ symporter
VVNTLVFLPLTGVFAALVSWLIPERPDVEKAVVEPRFLDEELIRSPSLALGSVRLELGHQGEIVREMLHRIRGAFASGRRSDLETVVKMDDQVDLLQKRILAYLGRIRVSPLTDVESATFVALMSSSDYLESIGDTIETGLGEACEKMIDRRISPSETAGELLDQLYDTVDRALASAVQGIRDDDPNAAQAVIAMKSEMRTRIDRVLRHQAERLGEGGPKRPTIFRVEMALVDGLKRTYTLSKRIARMTLPTELRSRS